MAELEGLTRLEVLGLQDTKVTAKGLMHLKDLARLNVLNLNNCRVGDDDLGFLVSRVQTASGPRGLQNLRIIHLQGCDISEARIQELKRGFAAVGLFPRLR